MPEAMTFWLSSAILTANFFTIYNFLDYNYFPELPFSLIIAFVYFGIIALINYLIIFPSGSFKEKTPSSSFGFGVVIYMIISIAGVIYVGSLQREKNLQEKERQHTEQRQ
jgi:high-affinity Fe2+/Pb2+ permease